MTTKLQKTITRKRNILKISSKNTVELQKYRFHNTLNTIKNQNLAISIEADEDAFLDIDYSLFEDENICIDVNLEIETENHPDYGKSLKSFKVIFLSAYSNEECEDILFTPNEIKQVIDFLQHNLIIDLS